MSCRWDRSWPFAQIDSQLIALFFEELFLNEELADLAFQIGGAAFLLLGRAVSSVLALKYCWHVILKLLFPSANLGGCDVVLLGDLQDALLALERLGGDTGFELGGKMSSISFHRSDFGGYLPLSDQLKFQHTTGSVLRDHFIGKFNYCLELIF